MQKIVLDTNVLVSALIQRSLPYLFIFLLSNLYIYKQTELCPTTNSIDPRSGYRLLKKLITRIYLTKIFLTLNVYVKLIISSPRLTVSLCQTNQD